MEILKYVMVDKILQPNGNTKNYICVAIKKKLLLHFSNITFVSTYKLKQTKKKYLKLNIYYL